MATEKRLIDAIALISKARRMETTDNNGIPMDTYAVPVLAIEDAPTVDAVEVVHGQWYCRCVCSECGEDLSSWADAYYETNYCPNCGAKMDGVPVDG